LLAAALLAAMIVYWPGLNGGYIFDDYPNIVDNPGVHINHATASDLAGAALSSPSSEFRRPLASLSFALNYLATGLDPWPMKLTNLLIHLCNGVLLYGMLCELLRFRTLKDSPIAADDAASRRLILVVTASWLLLPINLTAVLYVVQRMESLAQLAVLGGLWGYLWGRRRMLLGDRWRGLAAATSSLGLGVILGVLAKESAVLLPMYAFLVEYTVLRFANHQGRTDRQLVLLYVLVLALPATIGLAWLLPHMLAPAAYSTRPYTLVERLLTEPRVLLDYLHWTLLPDPRVLSLYHDDFRFSRGLLAPPSTLGALIALAALFGVAVWQRKPRPIVALGVLWFFAAHLLTATIVPLELVYEHRNYFASIGVLLALFTLLLGLRQIALPIVRGTVAALLLALFAGVTLLRAEAWSNPIMLAVGEANLHPESPRANYEAARLLVIASNYNAASRELAMAHTYLERAAALPDSSISSWLGLIVVADRSGKSIDPALWEHLTTHLRTRPVSEEDISALVGLGECRARGYCHFDIAPLQQALLAALSHPNPRPRLLGAYADFASQLLHDNALTERYLRAAIAQAPSDPGYRIGLTQLLAIHGRSNEALLQIEALRELNAFGRLDKQIAVLEAVIERYAPATMH